MKIFRKKIPDKINFLELVPKRNYDHETSDKGMINILIPKFTNRFMVENILPRLKHPYMKINLDEFGTEVWLQMDGVRSVGEIADILTKKFGERIQPVEERLTKFLSQLDSHKFISFNQLS